MRTLKTYHPCGLNIKERYYWLFLFMTLQDLSQFPEALGYIM